MLHPPQRAHTRPARIAWLEAILLFATFIRLSGQQTLPDPGTRVRISAPGLPPPGPRVIGTLQAWRPDTIVVTRDSSGDTLYVAMGAVRRLDVSEGVRSNADIGATTGLVFGLGLDVLVTFAFSRDREYALVAPAVAVYGLVVFGGGCTAIGGILGSTSHSEHWRRVRLPLSAPRLGLLPLGRGRLGVGLSLRL
jgi:hypothetical protein